MSKVINADGGEYVITADPALQKNCITFCPHCRRAVYVMWLKNPPGSLCHNCGHEWGNHRDWFEMMDKIGGARELDE